MHSYFVNSVFVCQIQSLRSRNTKKLIRSLLSCHSYLAHNYLARFLSFSVDVLLSLVSFCLLFLIFAFFCLSASCPSPLCLSLFRLCLCIVVPTFLWPWLLQLSLFLCLFLPLYDFKNSARKEVLASVQLWRRTLNQDQCLPGLRMMRAKGDSRHSARIAAKNSSHGIFRLLSDEDVFLFDSHVILKSRDMELT